MIYGPDPLGLVPIPAPPAPDQTTRYFARPDPAGVFMSVWTYVAGDPVAPSPADVEMTPDQAATYQALYWDGATIRDRQPLPHVPGRLVIRADGEDAVRVDGLPPGTAVAILQGFVTLYAADDAAPAVEFAATAPGRYELHLTCPPFLPLVLRVEAV